MGLDVTAYSGITKIEAALDEDGEPVGVEYDFRVYANPDFPGRAEGLEDRAYYTSDDSMEVLGLSYGGYNAWREMLACLAGYPEGIATSHGREFKTHCESCWSGQQGPFAELIDFSDCEGAIGPVVAAKLAKDFADFQGKADAFEWKAPFYKQAYSNFRKGCEMAAQNGALVFH